MVIVDCPMCLGPVAFGEDDAELVCEECSIHVALAPDQEHRFVAIAA